MKRRTVAQDGMPRPPAHLATPAIIEDWCPPERVRAWHRETDPTQRAELLLGLMLTARGLHFRAFLAWVDEQGLDWHDRDVRSLRPKPSKPTWRRDTPMSVTPPVVTQW